MLARFNLTALVAALALVDLVVDRLLARLFLAPAREGSPGEAVLPAVTGFISHLAGTLALLGFATSFVGLIRRRELFPRSLRMVSSILALFFVVLFANALANDPLSTRTFVQLRTCQAFLSWMIALSLWAAPIGVRAKVGATLFLLPPIFHTAALFVGEAVLGRDAALAGQLARVGELVAFLAAGFAPLLLPGSLRASRPGPLTWLAAVGTVTGLGVLAVINFDLLQMLALYGLRFELPAMSEPGGWAYLLLFALAVFGLITAVGPALRAGGGDRLAGYGLLMVVTAGYQIGSPPDLAVSTAGLLALGVGLCRRGAGVDIGASATPATAVAAPA
ncbi:MAG TPA: hypothetical protein VGF45_10850 [Polyangia bacterium]